MPRTRRAAGALAAAALAAASLLLGCDNNEYPFPTQSAGGSGARGGAFLAVDPGGDLLGTVSEGAPDATALSGSVRGDTIFVTIAFRNAVTPWTDGQANSLIAFLDLDMDESVGTGIPSAIDGQGGSTGQGVDYFVALHDVDSDSRVRLFDTRNGTMVRVPASFGATRVTVRIPRVMLPDEVPGFTISALVGHEANEATDFVPNSGSVKVRY